MEKAKKQMYSGLTSPVEVDRLKNFDYPFTVSRSVLEEISFDSLLDSGAGLNIKLAEYTVNDRKAKYSAFDSGKSLVGDMVQTFADIMRSELVQKGIQADTFSADVRNIPAGIMPADVVHQRFVFMHLSEADRRIALSELLRLAKKAVVLLEYDWSTIRSTNHSEILDQFIQMSFKTMNLFDVDPHAGENLKSIVSEAVVGPNVEFKNFQREEGDYTDEIIKLCKMQSELCKRAGESQLFESFIELANTLELSPITFVPPSVVCAKITI